MFKRFREKREISKLFADDECQKLRLLGKYEKALECYDKRIKMNPQDAVALFDAWCDKADLLFIHFRRFKEALECYDKAIENLGKVDENLVGVPQLLISVAWANKARILNGLEQFDKALESANKALELAQTDSMRTYSLSAKGVSLHHLKRLDEAIKCFDEAIKIESSSETHEGSLDWYWVSKGFCLSDMGQSDEAIKCCNKAIEINPNYEGAWTFKGVFLMKQGKYEEALKCFDEILFARAPDEKAVEEDKRKHPTLLYLAGICHENLNDYDIAQYYYGTFAQVASRAGFSDAIILDAIERFKVLDSRPRPLPTLSEREQSERMAKFIRQTIEAEQMVGLLLNVMHSRQ